MPVFLTLKAVVFGAQRKHPSAPSCPVSADGHPCGYPALSVSKLYTPFPAPRNAEGAPSRPEVEGDGCG